MKNMLSSSDEEGEDIFFDSVDFIRSCDSPPIEKSESSNVELVFRNSEYEVWKKEPESVRERREMFLLGMGFNDFDSSRMGYCREIDSDTSYYRSPEIPDLERITECSGAVSSSWFNDRVEENLDGSRRFRNDGSQARSDKMPSSQQRAHEGHDVGLDMSKKKRMKWWKSFTNKGKGGGGGMCKSDGSVTCEEPKTNRMKVQYNSKKFKEFTALYMGQEIQAHKGFIWTMKFSPDGKYLASGGNDGVVRIWRVTSIDASCKCPTENGSFKFDGNVKGGKSILGRKNSNPATVVIPEKVLKIEESPLQEFHGHTSDVLDLSWSNSNYLLSSSKDKTVRLWQVGCDKCLNVFHHSDYVTCVQFNPVDDGYFISGSIDGKARIWGVSERRVIDWEDVRDIVTAICYQPDGQRFVVGTITGSCRFYDALGNHLQLDAQICIQGRKKSSGNRITSIQFSPEDSQRVLITSADSKVRIFDGVDVVHKYKALRKSGSQTSASFTSNGRHIISVGEDSRVYVWNYDGLSIPLSKKAKSVRSCEHFFFEGVSVAIPWSGMESAQAGFGQCSSQTLEHIDAAPWPRESERFSLGGWFSMDVSSRGSITWPEEKLPLWSVQVADSDHHCRHHQYNHTTLSATWGLVIITAGWDGVIRTFHNYGLPVRQ